MLVENPLFELALNAVLGFFHSKRILRRCQTRALDTHRLGLCLKEFGTCITFVPQPLGANQLWHLEFLTGTTIRMSFFVIIYLSQVATAVLLLSDSCWVLTLRQLFLAGSSSVKEYTEEVSVRSVFTESSCCSFNSWSTPRSSCSALKLLFRASPRHIIYLH